MKHFVQASAVLVFVLAAGCGDDSPEPAPEEPCTVQVKLLDFSLSPSELAVPRGEVVLCAKNDGQAPHDLAVRDANGTDRGRTPVLGPGESARLELELAAGPYGIYCSQAGHESLGMRGTLNAE